MPSSSSCYDVIESAVQDRNPAAINQTNRRFSQNKNAWVLTVSGATRKLITEIDCWFFSSFFVFIRKVRKNNSKLEVIGVLLSDIQASALLFSCIFLIHKQNSYKLTYIVTWVPDFAQRWKNSIKITKEFFYRRRIWVFYKQY